MNRLSQIKPYFLKVLSDNKFRFIVFITILLFIPSHISPRKLYPNEISNLELESQYQEIIEKKSYTVPIIPDVSIYGKKLKLSELKLITSHDYFTRLKPLKIAYPYRAVTSIAFKLKPSETTKKCQIRAVVNHHHKSNYTDCGNLQDNRKASFYFNEPVPAGIVKIHFEFTPKTTEKLSIETITYGNSDYLVPFTGRGTINSIQALKTWLSQKPLTSAIYISLCLAILILFAKQRLSPHYLFLSLILFFTANTVITKFYSGFDETAHISMFNEAMKKNSNGISDFNQKTHQSMIENDFFRLHNVDPQMPNDCPHNIIGRCGISDGPTQLYSYYFKFAKLIPAIYLDKPEQILIFARTISVLLLCTTLLLTFLFFGKRVFFAVIPFYIFSGGYLSQFASLSNDIPMYLLSFIGIGCVLSITMKKLSKLTIFSVLFLMACYLLLRGIDESSISIFSWLVPFILFTFFLNSPKFRTLSIKTPKCLISGWAIPCLTLIFSFIFFKSANISHFFGIDLINIVEQVSPKRARLIENLALYSFQDVIEFFRLHFKSVLGAYVWGHSYYANFNYSILGMLWLWLSYKGIMTLKERFKGVDLAVLFITISLSMAVHITLLSIISRHDLSSTYINDVHLKARFLAPSLTAIWTLPAISTYHYWGQVNKKSKILTVSYLWMLILLLFYWPKFYLIDLW